VERMRGSLWDFEEPVGRSGPLVTVVGAIPVEVNDAASRAIQVVTTPQF
jgi:hypothetical protein